jgi:D-alanyl-lipoteichoic acid acyltransferase DltB (MBOAT superfamily)
MSKAWILVALYGYSLQVYADFSGYTDMAQGMAGLLGIQLPRNFNFPYRATSPADFWRRWHMSLSQWWRDYVYIPLGGNRRLSGLTWVFLLGMVAWTGMAWGSFGGWLVLSGSVMLAAAWGLMSPTAHTRIATAANALLVMLLGGLWHGAHVNFVTWGAINGLALVAWIVLSPSTQSQWRRALGWLFTFHVVVFSRIWFRAGSLVFWDHGEEAMQPEGAWDIALAMWTALTSPATSTLDGAVDFTTWGALGLMVLGYLLHLMPHSVRTTWEHSVQKWPLWACWLLWMACTVLAVWGGQGQTRPFIYWQF